MMMIHEMSRRTGVSIRALHHYDRIGLLPPSEVTEAGYRLYDDTALERLQCILLFKELGFPLKEIRGILDSPVFDRNQALDQQLGLELMGILAGFGQMKESDPSGEKAQARVRELKDFITRHYYTCTDEILLGLGSMYAGGSMTENINAAGGSGTAEFASQAIEAYCNRERK